MKVGFYAGSFDPFTNGHLHVVKEATKIFDKVIIGIGVNPDKAECRRFDKELMKQAIENVINANELHDKVEVVIFAGLAVDAAIEKDAIFFIRGIRNGMDYQEEENLAAINQELSGLDTMYFRAGGLGNISSSMVMELLKNNKDVSKYLPKEVLKLVNQK